MWKAVLFDMDGVLLDSETYMYQNCARIIAEKGLNFSADFYLSLAGSHPDLDPWPEILETYHIPFSPDEMEELFFGRSSQCVNDIDRGFLIFPEAKQVLESLKASGVQLACCSSSSRKYVEDTLKQGHLEGLFDFILAGDDKILPKPNPDVYLRCLKHFGLDAEDVLVVEDSALGLAAAKAAGLRAAARFNPNMPLDQSAADWIISDLSEIFSLH